MVVYVDVVMATNGVDVDSCGVTIFFMLVFEVLFVVIRFVLGVVCFAKFQLVRKKELVCVCMYTSTGSYLSRRYSIRCLLIASFIRISVR